MIESRRSPSAIIRRIAVLGLVLLGLSPVAFAQAKGTGQIAGQVTDPDGLALPGVTVTLSAPGLAAPLTAQSTPNGEYSFASLAAGLWGWFAWRGRAR